MDIVPEILSFVNSYLCSFATKKIVYCMDINLTVYVKNCILVKRILILQI